MCTNNLKQLWQAYHSSSLTLPLSVLLHRAVTTARCSSPQVVSLPMLFCNSRDTRNFYFSDVLTNNPWEKKKIMVPFLIHSFLFIILSMCSCCFIQLYLQEVWEELYWPLTRQLYKEHQFCRITLFRHPCAHSLALRTADFKVQDVNRYISATITTWEGKLIFSACTEECTLAKLLRVYSNSLQKYWLMAVARFWVSVFKAIITYAVKASEGCLKHFFLLWKCYQKWNACFLLRVTLFSPLWNMLFSLPSITRMLKTLLIKISYMDSLFSSFVW